MKRKFGWLIVSCLVITALILASCKAPVVEEKEVKGVVKEAEKKVEKVEEVVEEKTKYGGIITLSTTRPLEAWDITDTLSSIYSFLSFSHDTLVTADWWRDRNEYPLTTFLDYSLEENEGVWVGGLAESWERPNSTTLIFHIRKGVRWQMGPPVNGREFVAEDVEWHFKRLLDSPKHAGTAYVRYIDRDSIEATDKYTVVFKMKEPWVSDLKYIGIYRGSNILAREVAEQYGDFRNWKVHKGTGTGPFILEDYVLASSYTWSRNPDYWKKDPTGNQLPYVDGVKLLVIRDPATRIAAIRTRVLDYVQPAGIAWYQRASLEKSNPDLQFGESPDGGVYTIWPNTTVKPFDDVRVRQALSMGLDRQAINDFMFGGTSTTFSWPARHTWPADIFIPLDELPENVRELYEYNPEKAKQLLAEAGYPTLKFPIEYWASGDYAVFTEVLELLKDSWSKIGVDISLNLTVDWSAHFAKAQAGDFPVVATGNQQEGALIAADKMHRTGAPLSQGLGRVADPHLDDLLSQAQVEFDITKRHKILRELYLYMAEQMYGISMPTATTWTVWQPWVKGYNGEAIQGAGGAAAHIWLDLELRKQVTGK